MGCFCLDMPQLALVFGGDSGRRSLSATVLEESPLEVLECEDAEAALSILDFVGDRVALVVADLARTETRRAEALVQAAHARSPSARLVIAHCHGSGGLGVPPGTVVLPSAWVPLDLLRQAEIAGAS